MRHEGVAPGSELLGILLDSFPRGQSLRRYEIPGIPTAARKIFPERFFGHNLPSRAICDWVLQHRLDPRAMSAQKDSTYVGSRLPQFQFNV